MVSLEAAFGRPETDARRRLHRTVAIAGIIALTASLLRTAWISDDAYITFRTADNILRGYGPVWNVGERVQSYTHPLWLVLFTPAYAATGEVYYTAIALGIALSIASVGLIVTHLASTPAQVVAGFAALLSSKAFIDYSTSGLENPLTNLLLVIFLWQWWTATPGPARSMRLAFVAALCLLNRLDLGLLVGPAVVVDWWRQRSPAAVMSAVAGLLPFFIWEIVSTFYYGSPFPNTAYAKLDTGISSVSLLWQGVAYFSRTLHADPVTLLIIVLSVLAVPRARWPEDWPLVAGIFLFALYLARIGGDFMMGRFFGPPFVWSVALLVRSPYLRSRAVGVAAASTLVVVGLCAQWEPAVLSGYGFSRMNNRLHGDAGLEPRDRGRYLHVDGITDERRFYYEATGLLKQRAGQMRPNHTWVAEGMELRASGPAVVVSNSTGFRGYFAGAQLYIVDVYALSDPLLARLPACRGSRIGHFRRAIPEGYLETLRSGSNQLADPDLRAYYDVLHLVVTGPLWDRGRLAGVAALLTGQYSSYLQRFIERTPPC